MTGDCHVRFCERLGVKFPGATRLREREILQAPEHRPAALVEVQGQFIIGVAGAYTLSLPYRCSDSDQLHAVPVGRCVSRTGEVGADTDRGCFPSAPNLFALDRVFAGAR